MWRVHTNCCTHITEGGTGWGKIGCVCACVLEKRAGERSRKGIMHTCIACYMCCIFVIYVYKCTDMNSTLSGV